jgi:hypothetical protein
MWHVYEDIRCNCNLPSSEKYFDPLRFINIFRTISNSSPFSIMLKYGHSLSYSILNTVLSRSIHLCEVFLRVLQYCKIIPNFNINCILVTGTILSFNNNVKRKTIPVRSDVSEERSASIVRVTVIGELYPRNRSPKYIDMFSVGYEHHLHTKE